MTASTFNALAAARHLKAGGIEAEHAAAIAEGMREATDAAAGADLATKADRLPALPRPRHRQQHAKLRHQSPFHRRVAARTPPRVCTAGFGSGRLTMPLGSLPDRYRARVAACTPPS